MATKRERVGWQSFIDMTCNIEAAKDLDQFFNFIFTPEERLHIAKRVELVRELVRGDMTQREIARELKISLAKITRGSNGLKTIDAKLKKFLSDELV